MFAPPIFSVKSYCRWRNVSYQQEGEEQLEFPAWIFVNIEQSLQEVKTFNYYDHIFIVQWH